MGIEIEEPIREAFVCDTLYKKYHHVDWYEDRIPLTHESLTGNLGYAPEKETVNQ